MDISTMNYVFPNDLHAHWTLMIVIYPYITGIVAGAGINISGSTGNVTITNAGVHSINGATGAITNVARLNEGNTFSVRQVMNVGATMSDLYVVSGVTLASTTITLVNTNPK